MDRSKLISDLLFKLFEAERRRLAAEITELNARNKALRNSKTDGFIYNGTYFLPNSGSLMVAGPGQSKPTLDYKLHGDMEQWLKDRKAVKEDEIQIRQTLVRLLGNAHSKNQARDALPDCIVSLVPELAGRMRTDRVAWTLEHDERAKRQFEKILPRMEVYSATRLLY